MIRVDATTIELAVTGAPIDALLAALDVRHSHGVYFDNGEDLYACPACQSGDWHPATNAPAVTILSDSSAECCRCHRIHTLWALRHAVLCDADAIGRILDWEHAA